METDEDFEKTEAFYAEPSNAASHASQGSSLPEAEKAALASLAFLDDADSENGGAAEDEEEEEVVVRSERIVSKDKPASRLVSGSPSSLFGPRARSGQGLSHRLTICY